MPRLLAEFPKLQLALVGRGDFREELEKQAARMGTPTRCVHGHHDDIRDMLACFDVIVIPSRAEGLSLGFDRGDDGGAADRRHRRGRNPRR
jgi:glycosyltransferase involved in cell wall biosynthesis